MDADNAQDSQSGRLISFEGGVGVGKTTQLSLLAQWLQERQISVYETHEPGGSPLAVAVRSFLLAEPREQPLQPLTEALLYAAARLEHVENTIRPQMRAGQWVLCDRFQDSSYAVQGWGLREHQQEQALQQLEQLEQMVLGGLTPDLTFILDTPVDIAQRRWQAQNKQNHYYRHLDLTLQNRVRQGFLTIAAQQPKRCVVIDASESVEQVHGQIITQLNQRWVDLVRSRATYE